MSGTWREALWLLLGAAALIANWLCLFRAYAYSGIAIASVVYHVQPFVLLLLAAVLQGAPCRWRACRGWCWPWWAWG